MVSVRFGFEPLLGCSGDKCATGGSCCALSLLCSALLDPAILKGIRFGTPAKNSPLAMPANSS